MSGLKPVAFDLETIAAPEIIEMLPEVKAKATLKDPEKIKADIRAKQDKQILSMGMDPLHNRVCTAALHDGKDTLSYHITTDSVEAETGLIEWFWKTCVKAGYNYFIGFNSRPFDLRCIHLHGARFGVRPTIEIDAGRYNRGNHLDLRQVLSGSDMYAPGKLDFYMKYFGLEDKGGMSGDQVQYAFKLGEHTVIENYCRDDAEKTFNIYTKAKNGGLCV